MPLLPSCRKLLQTALLDGQVNLALKGFAFALPNVALEVQVHLKWRIPMPKIEDRVQDSVVRNPTVFATHPLRLR